MHLLALVLSDCERHEVRRDHGRWHVLMHLLVLGAFASHKAQVTMRFSQESNAPFGVRCFPTDAVAISDCAESGS